MEGTISILKGSLWMLSEEQSTEGQDGNWKHCQFTATAKETKDDSMYSDRFTRKGKMEKMGGRDKS